MADSVENIKTWLKNKDNLLLLIVVLLALIVRLYFFNLTQGQPIWWDEGEYLLKAKSIALGTPETGYWPGRPILFPAFLSIFYFLGLSEVSIRFFLVISSLVLVYLVYYIGEKLFDKRIGLIAAFLFSFTYINLFYTSRVMVDILSLCVSMLAFAFFFSKKPKLIWFFLPLLAIATLLRFPSFFLFVILGLHILLSEGLAAFKNKNYLISAGIAAFISILYMGWSYVKYGNPLYAIFYAGSGSIEGTSLSYGVLTFIHYARTFNTYFGILTVLMFVIGLFMLLETFLAYDIIFKQKSKPLVNKAFLILWIVIPIFYFSFWVSHYEDRYIFMAFPAILYAAALAIVKISSFVARDKKNIATLVIMLIVLIGSYQMLSTSNSIIKDRLTSFDSVQEAGLWLKNQAPEGSVVMARSVPEITYYSELETYTVPVEQSDFDANYTIIKPQYLIISYYDAPAMDKWQWAFALDQSKYGLQPAAAFPSANPNLIIYKTNFTKSA